MACLLHRFEPANFLREFQHPLGSSQCSALESLVQLAQREPQERCHHWHQALEQEVQVELEALVVSEPRYQPH